MKFLKKFFKKKKKQKEVVEMPLPPGAILCDLCKEPILQHEKRSKIQGKRYHKRCYKRFKKETLEKVYSGRPTL